MGKGIWFFCFGLGLAGFAIAAVLLGVNHESEEILISINGYSMTLNEAVDGNYLVDERPFPTASITTSIVSGHNANDITVSVRGVTQNLQEVIDGGSLSNRGLCSSGLSTTSGFPDPGHSSARIKIGSGSDSLQDAIDAGVFCDSFTYRYDTSDWGSCSSLCGPGTQERTYWCVRIETGVTMDNNYCDKLSLPADSESCDAGTCVPCSGTGVVEIGTQCWASEDVAGTYPFETARGGVEGGQGVCPTNFHVPTRAEWGVLENFYADVPCDGERINSEGCSPAAAAFKAAPLNLPGSGTGYWAYTHWTSTVHTPGYGVRKYLPGNGPVGTWNTVSGRSLAVRCIRSWNS